MITLQSQANLVLKVIGRDSAGNIIPLPSNIQANWTVGDPALLGLSHPNNLTMDMMELDSIGPVGSSTVGVSVVLPDMRTLTDSKPVEVTAGDVATIEITVL